MDAQVLKALAKWPNVPHCYGWLALDARGKWRMRDEQAQRNGQSGDRIAQDALIAFITRNYTHDEAGRWYFQNGPQRVYVELEVAPYIAHIEPGTRLMLHTGTAVPAPAAAWLGDRGNVWLCADRYIAMLDDRDLAHCLSLLSLDNQTVEEDTLHEWLCSEGKSAQLRLHWNGTLIAVDWLQEADAPNRFGFVRSPQAQRDPSSL